LLDKLSLPCDYQDFVTQLENPILSIKSEVKDELMERFKDDEIIDESSFEELDNYFDEEFFKQDE
jgi:hypothetical protein